MAFEIVHTDQETVAALDRANQIDIRMDDIFDSQSEVPWDENASREYEALQKEQDTLVERYDLRAF
jgi:hypothetical protein